MHKRDTSPHYTLGSCSIVAVNRDSLLNGDDPVKTTTLWIGHEIPHKKHSKESKENKPEEETAEEIVDVESLPEEYKWALFNSEHNCAGRNAYFYFNVLLQSVFVEINRSRSMGDIKLSTPSLFKICDLER